MVPGLFNIFSLSGGSAEFSSDLALHCVLELPSESGEIPRGPVDLDHVADDEARLFYQPLNGGQEPVFNALQRENTELLTWHRFQIISWTLQIHRDHPIISPKQLQPHFFILRMDTKYGIHYTSNEIVREAKQYLLNTTRPETPAQCSRNHLAQGDTIPRKHIVNGTICLFKPIFN